MQTFKLNVQTTIHDVEQWDCEMTKMCINFTFKLFLVPNIHQYLCVVVFTHWLMIFSAQFFFISHISYIKQCINNNSAESSLVQCSIVCRILVIFYALIYLFLLIMSGFVCLSLTFQSGSEKHTSVVHMVIQFALMLTDLMLHLNLLLLHFLFCSCIKILIFFLNFLPNWKEKQVKIIEGWVDLVF